MKYSVAVRALAEFTARAGDLDLRFTPAPSAAEGMAGHAAVVARRPAGYQSEISLAGEFGALSVRGRADGYDPVQNRLEEIKTYRGDFARIPANQRHLHWAQAKLYGWLLCERLGLAELKIALVYFEIGQRTETELLESFSAAELKTFFEQHCTRFLDWAGSELQHRAARDGTLATLRFPHPAFRAGQRKLSEAVYRAACRQRVLMAQAPTGIGKTIGTLFPLLRAAAGQKLDKIFFLTAKTSGRALALDALARIRGGEAVPLRVLELVARDKACVHPDKACHGESCPLAHGFYDRLPQARSAAIAQPLLDKAGVADVARKHEICPYYLAQELVRWSDVVVGDYNYYFDGSALLHALTESEQWRVGLLVDEAHNLLDRARAMYSAELDPRALQALRRSAPPVLKKDLDRLQRSWSALATGQTDAYRIVAELPAAFVTALAHAVAAIASFHADHPNHADAALQNYYFDLLHFQRMLDSLGDHSLIDCTLVPLARGRQGALLGIRNLIPAPFLAPRFSTAQSCTLFSATLSPWHFYADTLGLPQDVGWIEAESPFDARQLEVRIARHISTRFRDRAASMPAIVDLIGVQYARRAGNYLAFFSSFDYLQQAFDAFRARFPDTPAWAQTRGMDEGARADFLARFTDHGSGIGFAVLGGAFGEGIDLEGERLVGAFVATLGLPQLNPFNEEVRARMDASFGNGYDYTYLFPGLRKVVQAAGRVIRTPQDRGVVILMDDRFARADVQSLLPQWWKLEIS